MEHFTTDYDHQFQKIDLYKKFVQYYPWVGSDYKSPHNKKLLLLGESHYLPSDSSVHLNDFDWYYDDNIELTEDEFGWTNARWIIDSGKNRKWGSQAHWIFKHIEEALLESGFNPPNKENLFRYVSFMNFFQRPAQETGEGIIHTALDRKMSYETIESVVSILHPDIIVFISQSSWKAAGQTLLFELFKNKNITYDYSPHPTCQWWNREAKKYGNMTGKQKFISIIKNNKFSFETVHQ